MSYDNNKANQQNPNHEKSGPGRSAGYHGLGTKADLDNHSNQMNPNNSAYQSSRRGNQAASESSDSWDSWFETSEPDGRLRLADAGYRGSGTTADLYNHSNQMNSNHPAYHSSHRGNQVARYGTNDTALSPSADDGQSLGSWVDTLENTAKVVATVGAAVTIASSIWSYLRSPGQE